LFDLRPGEYKVAVVTPRLVSGRSGEYYTTWFPSALTPAASPTLEVAPGQEYQGVDLRVPDGKASLFGLVTGESLPRWPSQVELWTETVGYPPARTPAALAEVTDDGTFLIERVPEGQYRLRVVDFPPVRQGGGRQVGSGGFSLPIRGLSPLPDAETLWGEVSFLVDRDVQRLDATVRLERGARIHGRVEFSHAPGENDAVEQPRIAVLVDPGDGSVLPQREAAPLQADGTFRTVGLPPGQYQVGLTPLVGWSLERIMVAGVDWTGRPVDVGSLDVRDVVLRLTDRPPTVTGMVLDASGSSPVAAMVYAFPVKRTLWTDTGTSAPMLGIAWSDLRGHFRLTGAPPGDYYLAATTSPPLGAPTAAYLASLVTDAERVTLEVGREVGVTLRAR
jgi:hypothetical protein